MNCDTNLLLIIIKLTVELKTKMGEFVAISMHVCIYVCYKLYMLCFAHFALLICFKQVVVNCICYNKQSMSIYVNTMLSHAALNYKNTLYNDEINNGIAELVLLVNICIQVVQKLTIT